MIELPEPKPDPSYENSNSAPPEGFYPVTSVVALLAISVMLAHWKGSNLDGLLLDIRAWHGQPWRLFTSVLVHGDPVHLFFNLYWLWVFGIRVEKTLGRWAAALLLVLFVAASSAAQYAFSVPGIGLSGVDFGLLGLLWVLSRKDPRFTGAIQVRTVCLFVGWAALCVIITEAGIFPIANVAHISGAAVGILAGFAIASRGRQKVVWSATLLASIVMIFLASTVGRPYVIRSSQEAADLAVLGYVDLEAGRNEEAVTRYERAVELDPNRADDWYNLGVADQRISRWPEAIVAFEKAAALEPADKKNREALVETRDYFASATSWKRPFTELGNTVSRPVSRL